MDSFRRDPGETSERGAKRPRLPAVFEAVKAGRFDETRRPRRPSWCGSRPPKQNKTLSDQPAIVPLRSGDIR